jgi:hypothetical protein
MEFNIKKFLIENSLTGQSQIKENYRDKQENLTILQRCIELGDKDPDWQELKAEAIEIYEDYKEHKSEGRLDGDIESLLDSYQPPSSVIPYETPDEDSRGASRGMREDNNTNLIMPTGDQDEEMFGDEEKEEEPEGEWDMPDANDRGSDFENDDFEKEPTAKDVKQGDATLTGIHKKQAQLQDLEAQKDRLLMQLKGNVIGLDQYKQAIGNIPMQIKKLRADLDQAMNVTLDTDSEEEAI